MIPRSVHAADLHLELQLEPDRRDRGGVLEAEVAREQLASLVVEHRLGLVVELEPGELRVLPQRRRWPRRGTRSARSWVRSAGLQHEQPLERRVHERAPRGRDRRRLGQVVDGREPERQPAVGERRHLRRRQARGQRQRHVPRVFPGCDSDRVDRRQSGVGEAPGPRRPARWGTRAGRSG